MVFIMQGLEVNYVPSDHPFGQRTVEVVEARCCRGYYKVWVRKFQTVKKIYVDKYLNPDFEKQFPMFPYSQEKLLQMQKLEKQRAIEAMMQNIDRSLIAISSHLETLMIYLRQYPADMDFESLNVTKK